jgi:hypothetical protein
MWNLFSAHSSGHALHLLKQIDLPLQTWSASPVVLWRDRAIIEAGDGDRLRRYPRWRLYGLRLATCQS